MRTIKIIWNDYLEELLRALAYEYCENAGEPQDTVYYIEMIKDESKQNGRDWECFEEFVKDELADLFEGLNVNYGNL